MPFLVVQGPSLPAVAHRFDDDRIRIGRAPTNDLVVRDVMLSRQHAEIRREAQGWILVDLESRNGTSLNGELLRTSMPLEPGDRIEIGRTTIIFEVREEKARSRSSVGVLDRSDSTVQVHWSGAGSGAVEGDPALVGRSEAIRELLRVAARVADSPSTVLVTGESGTGKELVARLLHQLSSRRKGSFVAINCPAIPESLFESELFGVERGAATGVEPRKGRFELADGGTVFLDEIGDLPLAAQAKILRVLQEKVIERVGGTKSMSLDVRVIAATNHDLEADVARGVFRRDLFHRLSVVRLRLPPLRERLEDVRFLVSHFLTNTPGPVCRVSDAALERLENHDYPGNVRELEHAIEYARLVAENGEIRPEHLPRELFGAARANAVAGTPAGAPAEVAERLFTAIRAGGSFWDLVRGPYLSRSLSKDVARLVIERGFEEGGRSYKGMARLFGIEGEHKKLLDFLRHHDLGVTREPS